MPALQLIEEDLGEAPMALGLGICHGAQALLRRRPTLRGQSVRLPDLLDDVVTTALLLQLLYKSHNRRQEDTPPFRFNPWMWISSLELPGDQSLRQELYESLGDAQRHNLSGQTDSELLFQLFLTHLQDSGSPPTDWMVSSEKVVAALRQAIRHWEGRAGGSARAAVLMSNGQSFYALSLGKPLWMLPLIYSDGRYHGVSCIGQKPSRQPSAWIFSDRPEQTSDGCKAQPLETGEVQCLDTELAQQSVWL